MTEAKVSRMISDRVAISNTVLAAVTIHGPEVVPAVETLLFPGGVPQALTVAQVLKAFGAVLEARSQALVKADRAHNTELADDEGFRMLRDERHVDLKDLLSGLRSNLIRNYGAVVAGAYGLGAAMPEDAPALLVLAGNVEELLRTRPLTEPGKKKSMKIDPIAAADDVKEAADAVRAAFADVEREKREAQITLNTKSEAMAAWATAYSAVADMYSAIFVLVGRQDLAERVRPTARRRAGLPEADDTPPAETQAEGQPPTGQAGTAPTS